jgi:hypothetical protein
VTIPSKRRVADFPSSVCRTYGRAAIVFAALIVISTGALASSFYLSEQKPEKPYALIYGTVFGPDNRSVYGIRVKIRRSDQKKARWELYSDHAGEFAQRVPAGRVDYVVFADLKSCKAPECKKLREGTEVTVHIQNDERADISLHLK